MPNLAAAAEKFEGEEEEEEEEEEDEEEEEEEDVESSILLSSTAFSKVRDNGSSSSSSLFRPPLAPASPALAPAPKYLAYSSHPHTVPRAVGATRRDGEVAGKILDCEERHTLLRRHIPATIRVVGCTGTTVGC